MTYQEAIEKAFTVKWQTATCSQGEQCWCRMIKPEKPILFKESEEQDYEEEYHVIGMGELSKETAEYFVKLHNETFNK